MRNIYSAKSIVSVLNRALSNEVDTSFATQSLKAFVSSPFEPIQNVLTKLPTSGVTPPKGQKLEDYLCSVFQITNSFVESGMLAKLPEGVQASWRVGSVDSRLGATLESWLRQDVLPSTGSWLKDVRSLDAWLKRQDKRIVSVRESGNSSHGFYKGDNYFNGMYPVELLDRQGKSVGFVQFDIDGQLTNRRKPIQNDYRKVQNSAGTSLNAADAATATVSIQQTFKGVETFTTDSYTDISFDYAYGTRPEVSLQMQADGSVRLSVYRAVSPNETPLYSTDMRVSELPQLGEGVKHILQMVEVQLLGLSNRKGVNSKLHNLKRQRPVRNSDYITDPWANNVEKLYITTGGVMLAPRAVSLLTKQYRRDAEMAIDQTISDIQVSFNHLLGRTFVDAGGSGYNLRFTGALADVVAFLRKLKAVPGSKPGQYNVSIESFSPVDERIEGVATLSVAYEGGREFVLNRGKRGHQRPVQNFTSLGGDTAQEIEGVDYSLQSVSVVEDPLAVSSRLFSIKHSLERIVGEKYNAYNATLAADAERALSVINKAISALDANSVVDTATIAQVVAATQVVVDKFRATQGISNAKGGSAAKLSKAMLRKALKDVDKLQDLSDADLDRITESIGEQLVQPVQNHKNPTGGSTSKGAVFRIVQN